MFPPSLNVHIEGAQVGSGCRQAVPRCSQWHLRMAPGSCCPHPPAHLCSWELRKPGRAQVAQIFTVGEGVPSDPRWNSEPLGTQSRQILKTTEDTCFCQHPEGEWPQKLPGCKVSTRFQSPCRKQGPGSYQRLHQLKTHRKRFPPRGNK